MKVKTDLFEIFVVIIILAIISFIAYQAYGRLTQHEVVTVEVTDKNVRAEQNCSTKNNNISCSTSGGVYGAIQVGKKHTFAVSGWKNSRYITRVLE